MEDLWRIRQRKQMSISELSSKSGVPARRIQEYEAGKRTITASDLPRLARALYVEEWDIKPLSAPMPKPKPRKPQAPPPRATPVPKPKARPKPKRTPSQQQPARPSQIEHMRQLAAKLGLDDTALEQHCGKPLADLTRGEAAKILKALQEAIGQAAPDQIRGKHRRPYLPESVDAQEYRYLLACQESGAHLTFALFDGQEMEGRVVGFSPYTITIQTPSGDEVTLRKLAIAYYRRQNKAQEDTP